MAGFRLALSPSVANAAPKVTAIRAFDIRINYAPLFSIYTITRETCFILVCDTGRQRSNCYSIQLFVRPRHPAPHGRARAPCTELLRAGHAGVEHADRHLGETNRSIGSGPVQRGSHEPASSPGRDSHDDGAGGAITGRGAASLLVDRLSQCFSSTTRTFRPTRA